MPFQQESVGTATSCRHSSGRTRRAGPDHYDIEGVHRHGRNLGAADVYCGAMAQADIDKARQLLAAGRPDAAMRAAWQASTPAARVQNNESLIQIRSLAEEIALASDGATRTDAEQLAAFCTACLLEPRDTSARFWSIKGWFRRDPTTRKCPDCAEQIASDAKVCRFCGYRLAPPPTS